MGNWSEIHSLRNYFLQNPYFKNYGPFLDFQFPTVKSTLLTVLNYTVIEVVIVSLIPSVLPEANKRFSEANNLLKNLVKSYENASFLNLSPTLSPSDNVAPVYFKSLKVDPRTNRQRNVHLNGIGANRLAYSIFDHCTRFVVNKFKWLSVHIKSPFLAAGQL